MDIFEQTSNAIAEIVERNAPAVVRIEARRRAPSSGVVWSDRAVVAANHAVEWDEEIAIGLGGGDTATADVAGRDPATDLAVLRLRGGTLSPPRWATPETSRTGSFVVAISRPGLAERAHVGVLASRGGAWRTPAGGRIDAYLESTVPIRLGFSGSLLVSAAGDGLGVNTSGLRRSASLAVPASTARRIVDALLAHGRIRRGFLGIGTCPVRLPADLALRTGRPTGLLVVSVAPDGPAAKAGILFGDVLIAVNGRAVGRAAELMQALDEESVGKTAAVRIVRAGEIREIAVAIAARDA